MEVLPNNGVDLGRAALEDMVEGIVYVLGADESGWCVWGCVDSGVEVAAVTGGATDSRRAGLPVSELGTPFFIFPDRRRLSCRWIGLVAKSTFRVGMFRFA